MEIANLSFLIPALACVAAIIALYVSQPQRPRLALVSAFFMILIASWQGYDSYQEWGTRQTVEKYAYSRLESTTRNTLGLLSQILRGASDGWLPTMTMSSSQIETASIACRYLNVERRAPVIPDRDWLIWIDQQTKKSRDEYSAVLDSYASSLDDELLQSIIEFKNSFLLTFPPQWVASRRWDAQKGYQRPPLLCHGLESLMQKSLGQLRRLYEVLWRRTGSKPYPMPKTTAGVAPTFGSDRFTDDDLKRWAAEHPYAPSGKPPK